MGSPMERNHINDDMIKKDLFRFSMKGKWDEVIDIYKKYPCVHAERITRSGQTALHIAISDGREEKVAELVKIIVHPAMEKLKADHHDQDASKILSETTLKILALTIGDERGNTPLHIAASLGSARMCECIAGIKDASLELIGARNRDSETPFFLAAFHGHKEAFLRLHSIIANPESSRHQDYAYCRKNDGETILHCAISGDYFDLAFQISHLYEQLLNSVNEQGVSPLHLLATKPSAFRSGSHFGRFDKIIYHCTFVERLKKVEVKPFHFRTDNEPVKPNVDNENKYFPENYKTCCNIISLLQKTVYVAFGRKEQEAKPSAPDTENPPRKNELPSVNAAQGHQLFPPNYKSCFDFVKLVSKAMLVILGLGSKKIRKIREKKEKHTWSVQIMNRLLDAPHDYEDDGTKPPPGSISEFPSTVFESIRTEIIATLDNQDSITSTSNGSETNKKDKDKEISKSEASNKGGSTSKKETPILIAAKNGITEIVQKILEKYPVAIQDMNADKKNIVLLAVENRQPHVYQLLLKITTMKESVFRKVDNKGNSALHLAATLGDHKPWLIPGAALQMQWEIKWYEFVKDSMPFHFFVRYNKDSKTPKDIFTETHRDLLKAGGAWLTNTSESCSVVAALIATVAFATSATVPGGVKADSGTPTLENQPAFNVFAISSLVALCFSVNAVVMFLSILTSRYQEKDFHEDLPRKLLVGLTSLFVSIASMLISFCAGHFFVLKDKLKFAAFPVYAVTCLPVTFFAFAQFPLYFDLAWATFKKVPQRSYKSIPI